MLWNSYILYYIFLVDGFLYYMIDVLHGIILPIPIIYILYYTYDHHLLPSLSLSLSLSSVFIIIIIIIFIIILIVFVDYYHY